MFWTDNHHPTFMNVRWSFFYDDNTSSYTRVFEFAHGFKGEQLDIHVDPRFRQPEILTDETII